ncbi:MAG: 2-phosphosulfolactate phosphatase [candidate division Zixibacteria bacterium]|nr:2-phosphosulfolactate phosphatase [candidate division Zixibacteria bacterium]
MDIQTFFSAEAASQRNLEGRNVLVIDVLRATTSMITALTNGAKTIIPVESVVKARAMLSQFPKGTALLCGERGFDRLEGFHLGNSPMEYNRDAVNGKSLVFTSTNGTRGVTAGLKSDTMVMGAFINFPRPADYLVDLKKDLTIICCGTTGYFSLEDAVCGGMFIHYISKNLRTFTTNDASEAAMALFRRYRDRIPMMMETCENGRQLSSMGYHQDVAYCSQIGKTDIVPISKGNELVALEPKL